MTNDSSSREGSASPSISKPSYSVDTKSTFTSMGVPSSSPSSIEAVPYVAARAPTATLQAICQAARSKALVPWHKLCVQSILAGAYIAMAGQLFLVAGGGILGAALFPNGLLAVVFTGAELFTGDALVFTAGLLNGVVSGWDLIRHWTVSWTFNFVGALIWASLMTYAADALDENARDFAIAVAVKKGTAGWIPIFLKAVGANFLVCLGVWQSLCSVDIAGKVLALWFPISAFVFLGFEHVIANQYFLPLGMWYGADLSRGGSSSIGQMLWGALLPATLGNIVGGSLCFGVVYWYLYDVPKTIQEEPVQKLESSSQHDPSVATGGDDQLENKIKQRRSSSEVAIDQEDEV